MRAAALTGALLLAFAASALAQGTALDRAYDNVVAARAALARAEEARKAGEEPLPGERQGTAKGRSRLNDAYWARQKRLERDVERAQKRLDEALKRWNAVR